MPSLRLSKLCQIMSDNGFRARLEGEDKLIESVNTLEQAREGEFSFLANPKYLPILKKTRASAVVVRNGVEAPDGVSLIRCDEPYAALCVAIVAIHGHRTHPRWGIHERADIHPTARIGANPNIAAGVTISANVSIGDNCNLYPGCYVADGATIGNDCTLFPNVVIYDKCELGDRVTIHAGSVIGEDGLGYAPYEGKWVKIPQVGNAVIHDDVEIGANCAIDRATLGRTEIGAGSKFGNVVVIGHGAEVGPDCMFVGQVGVAGSVKVGRHVTLAGQVGVAGHLSIGDNVTSGAQSGIAGNIAAGKKILGTPAVDFESAKRSMVAVQKLPEWIKRIKELEREVAELRAQLDGRS